MIIALVALFIVGAIVFVLVNPGDVLPASISGPGQQKSSDNFGQQET